MFKKLLAKIARALSKKKIPYMVIGGHAVMAYGHPRLTEDIDITVGIGKEGFSEMERIVSKLNFEILVENPAKFVQETMVLPVRDKKSRVRIDFIFSTSVYEKGALKRVKKIPVGDAQVLFASLEDLLIQKLVADRPRDIEDVKNILIRNSDYDGRYLRKWLKKFDSALGGQYLSHFEEVLREIKWRK